MSNHLTSTEARIDRVLNALRDAEPPTNLEARITARIASTTEARPVTASYFAIILNAAKDRRILLADAKLYTFAATTLALLLTLSLFVLHLHHKPLPIAQSKPIPNQPYASTQSATLSQASSLGNTPVPQASSLGNTQVRQGFSLGPHTANPGTGVLTPASSQQPTDPDTIALAETLAPSRPAPPMPLTQQERLMLSVLRSGDQEEIAALNPAERDFLFAQDQAAFQNFFAPPIPAPTPGDKK